MICTFEPLGSTLLPTLFHLSGVICDGTHCCSELLPQSLGISEQLIGIHISGPTSCIAPSSMLDVICPRSIISGEETGLGIRLPTVFSPRTLSRPPSHILICRCQLTTFESAFVLDTSPATSSIIRVCRSAPTSSAVPYLPVPPTC